VGYSSKEVAEFRTALGEEYAKDVPLPDARRNVEARFGLAKGATLAYDDEYFALVGREFPLKGIRPGSKPATVALAVLRRRLALDGAKLPKGGRFAGRSLVRWEAVAASLSESLGKGVSVREVAAIFATAPDAPKESYAGRGTRIAAPDSRKAAPIA
jgi:hypothetical protein